MKLRGIILLIALSFQSVLAQKPVVQDFLPKKTTVDDTILISGIGFNQESQVYFGETKAVSVLTTPTSIKSIVPPSAAYGPIKVVNKNSGLSGVSTHFFTLSFSGSDFQSQLSTSIFPASSGMSDLALGDLNNDGLADVVASNNNDFVISVFLNNGSAFQNNFSKADLPTSGFTLGIGITDLNNDGLQDIYAGKGGDSGNQIYIFKNTSTSTIQFQQQNPLTTNGLVVRKVIAKDLNNDGKPEIISIQNNSNQIHIYKNISSANDILFETSPNLVTVPNVNALASLAVEDINNDGKVDFIASSFFGKDVFVIINKTDLNFSFVLEPTSISTEGIRISYIAVADIDGDSKKDIIITNVNDTDASQSNVIIYKNLIESTIKFSSAIRTPNVPNPWALDIGDVNGDGKIDIVCVSRTDSKASILLNNTASSDISFQNTFSNLGQFGSSLKIADANGDGKPDLLTAGITENRLVFVKNTSCILSNIVPSQTILTCIDKPVLIKAPLARNVLYEWYKDNVIIPGSSLFYHSANQKGAYAAIVKSENNCNSSSTSTTVNVIGDNIPENSAITIQSSKGLSFCDGDSTLLEVVPFGNSFLNYSWNTNSTAKSLFAKEAGLYKVEVLISPGCVGKGELPIEKKSRPIVKAGALAENILPGELAYLSAQGAQSYIWSPGKVLDDSLSQQPIANLSVSTTFNLKGIGVNNCIGTDDITIFVIDPTEFAVEPDVFFSPNGDEINDRWQIKDIEKYPNTNLIIFDVTGKIVLDQNNYKNDWDGSLNGRKLPDGVYFYKVEWRKFKKSGSINLAR